MNYEEFKKELDNIPWYKEIYYKIYRFFYRIGEIPREIKWFFQRGKNGYAECDVWSLCNYLEEWLPKAIRDLKENISGCPSELYDKENKGKECERWENILEKIIQGFEASRSLSNLDFFTEDNKIDKKKEEELNRKFNEGMKLFAKYFNNLWD